MQRSGTTVTHLVLRGHPNVSSLSDELKVQPFFDEGLGIFTSSASSSASERQHGKLSLFDALTGIDADENTLARGLKVNPRSVEDAELVCRTIREEMPGLRVILMIRDDLVAQLGSRLRAERTGEWHSWTKGQGGASGSFEIDAEKMQQYAAEAREIAGQLRGLSGSHEVLEISYERDLLQDLEQGQLKLFRFLDLPEVTVDWLDSKKVSPAPEDFISNYSELKSLIS
jgi:hypothetical protein